MTVMNNAIQFARVATGTKVFRDGRLLGYIENGAFVAAGKVSLTAEEMRAILSEMDTVLAETTVCASCGSERCWAGIDRCDASDDARTGSKRVLTSSIPKSKRVTW